MKLMHRNFGLYLFLFIGLSVITAGLSEAQTLSGPYTIDASGGAFDPVTNKNFISVSEAVDSLMNMGVSAHVVFDIAAGSYNGQYALTSIAGAGVAATVTFQAADGDSNSVFLSYSMNNEADNHIFKMTGVSYVTLKHLNFDATSGNTSYGTAIKFLGGNSNLAILNNVLVGKTGSSGSNERRALVHSSNTEDNDILIKQNVFSLGEKGISMSGISTSISTGIVVENNEFYDQYEASILLRYMQSPVARNNIIKNVAFTGKTGIYLEYVDQAAEITGNKIYNQDGFAGINVYNCDGNPGNEMLIANNFITTNCSGSSSTNNGIRIYNSTRIKIYHNSVLIQGSWNTTSDAFYQGGTHSNLGIRNNNFINYSGGYAYYFEKNTVVGESDHNNYFTTGNFLGKWNNNSDRSTVAQIASNTLSDANSISVYPVFASNDDLHTTIFHLEGKGADLTTDVPLDIDGEARNASFPDIGADEFTGAGLAMSGPYTIGGSSPDFATLSAAVDSLREVGISDNTYFNIRDADSPYSGTYNIHQITGAGTGKRLTIQPDPANTGEVVLTYAGTANRTLHFVRASYITVKDLTLTAGNSSYPSVIRFNGMSRFDSILNCKVVSLGTSSNNACIISVDDIIGDIAIIGNEITDGYSGIRFDGLDIEAWYPQNISIKDNIIGGHYNSGIYQSECNAPEIVNNDISPGSSNSQWWGVYLYRNKNNYKITENNILYTVDDGGIVVYNCSGSSTFRGLIANNYIEMSGTEGQYNIHTLNSDYVDVIHNTALATVNNAGSSIFFNSGGSNVRVWNNNFINFGTGYAYNNATISAITKSDNNNLFFRGDYIGRWGTNDYPSLSSFSTVNEMDQNSISVNPWMLESGKPDIRSSFVDDLGFNGTGITTDFYGAARSGTPDIGAVEFTSVSVPLTGSYTIGGTSPDFETIRGAADSLMLKGISGPVTMNIRAGIYNEFIGAIYTVPGASNSDTIVITSETGMADDVGIIYTTDDILGTIIQFLGVSHLTIKDLTISAQGTSYGRPLGAWGAFENINLTNNNLSSANTAWAVVAFSGIFDKVNIIGNSFTNGARAIGIYGRTAYYATNVNVSENNISGSKNDGIRFEYCNSPMASNNFIETKILTSFEGIRLYYCNADMRILNNRIHVEMGDKGINFSYCSAVSPYYGLVANNEISVKYTSSSYIYGIRLDNTSGIKIYHNSINTNSLYSSNRGRGVEVWSGCNEIDFKNNIIASTGNGFALVVQDPNDVKSFENNNLYSSADLASWNNVAYSDLAALSAVSNLFDNSISLDPMFYSDFDLRNSEQGHWKAGASLFSFVSTDIDSLPRHATTPDLGAYKFYCDAPDFNVYVTPTCHGDSVVIIDSSMNILPGSFRGWDFNGDLVADVITYNDFDTITWLFSEAGEHIVTYIVQQTPDCNDFINVDVSVTPAPILEITTQGAYCDTADGSASVSITNIPGPFEYFWSDDQTGSTATGLAIGTYTVAVTNPTGCSTTEEVIIGEAIEVTVTQVKASDCGIPDGIAVVTASGGFTPYQYVWSNGETSDSNTVLSPGAHYVNVIDSKGCYAQGSVNIASEGGPQITAVNVINNDCYGGSSGRIDISIAGGVQPYSILWSNGMKTEDIDSLAAGIYNVTVEDADGCLGAASFQVYQSARISISPVVSNATCNGADGSAVAVVSGGTKPYVYSWSSGGIYQIEEGLEAGVYSVTVTDLKGCTAVEPILVNNVGAPTVTIETVEGVGCTITDNGSISISVSPPNPFYTYKWSSGETTPSISGLVVGTYEVTVSDQAGCKGVNQAMIIQEPPDVNPICMVTVDTATGKNVVIWEKLVTNDVSHYNIYRESSVKGDYQIIASVDALDESIFVDSIADPTVRSWRYKLSVVDDCGNESALSDHHKTMHLTMNVGLDQSVNLIWDHYEGFAIPTYEIWRYDSAGDWSNISNMPSNLTSYTDATPPKQDLTYFIEVDHPTGCTSDDKKASTLNSSRSNRKNRLKGSEEPSSIMDLMSIGDFQIYPNPGPGLFNLKMDLDQPDYVYIKVFDISGKLILTKEFENVPSYLEEQIDLTGYSEGLYQIQVKTSKALIHRILIKK
ncbi:MAG TPA: T9SS type A sorting domain-containing protein [Bacteroides sp.]|nr:T9SS type A sorting domain-containing protein [Bacteroides sp.]